MADGSYDVRFIINWLCCSFFLQLFLQQDLDNSKGLFFMFSCHHHTLVFSTFLVHLKWTGSENFYKELSDVMVELFWL